MEIRYADSRDPEREQANGKIALVIESNYSPDAYVTMDELLELRGEIDKFLFQLLLKR